MDSDTEQPTEDTIPTAPAHSLLGQLQRGRGAGYLWALQEPPAIVREHLIDCISHDPLWDSQIEHRAEYYAHLALHTGLDLVPLDQYLHTTTDDRFTRKTLLTLDTLGSLARLGQAAAVLILRDYISYGPNWDAALQQLAELPSPEATVGLADVIGARFETGAQLERSAVYGLFSSPAIGQLWDSWRALHPGIARLLDEVPSEQPSSRRPNQPDYPAETLYDLLAAANARNRRQIEKILLGRLRPADVDHYAAAFATNNPFAWSVALHSLMAMKRAAPFYDRVLDRVITYLESVPEQAIRGAPLGALGQILTDLPPAMTLPIARRWFEAPDWYLQVAADEVLEAHATPDDIPRCQARLAVLVGNVLPYETAVYQVCSALDILARFPDIGALPEVEAAFVQSGYAFARARAAQALHVNAPARFAEAYAYECLWDCEEETRQLGSENVPLGKPGARERLQAFIDDPWES